MIVNTIYLYAVRVYVLSAHVYLEGIDKVYLNLLALSKQPIIGVVLSLLTPPHPTAHYDKHRNVPPIRVHYGFTLSILRQVKSQIRGE